MSFAWTQAGSAGSHYPPRKGLSLKAKVALLHFFLCKFVGTYQNPATVENTYENPLNRFLACATFLIAR